MNRLKLLILSSLVTILPGCAVWDAYWMAGYDNNEYALVNKVRTLSEVSIEDCTDVPKSKENVKKIYSYSIELKNFTQYISDNQDANKLASKIVEITSQAKEQYDKSPNVSETFCKLKLQQIGRSAEVAQKVIGAKPR